MKRECACCGLEIKKTSRTLPTCKCGETLCWKCAGSKCKDCTIISEERQIVRNYFTDKYLEKIKPVITTLLFIILLSLGAVAQVNITNTFIKQDCTTKSIPYLETIIDDYDEFYYSENDSTSYTPVYKEVTLYKSVTTCEPEYLEINSIKTETILQGYKCTKQVDQVVCDSLKDGNGDGKCDSGETCCIIKDNIKSCLNGIRKELPFKAFEVTK